MQSEYSSKLRLGSRVNFYALPSRLRDSHIVRERYRGFILPPAIRPAYDLKVVPVEGFCWRMGEGDVPCALVSVSRGRILLVLRRLLEFFGQRLTWVELTNDRAENSKRHIFSYGGIDPLVLASHLSIFEDFIVGDGAVRLSFEAQGIDLRITLEEHKLLCVTTTRKKYERALVELMRELGIEEKLDMWMIIDDPRHIHLSAPRREFSVEFKKLRTDLKLIQIG